MDYSSNFAKRDNLYFNSASSGILTLNAIREAKRYLDIMSLCADLKLDEYFNLLDSARNECAKLIKAQKENIGLIQNTTVGVFIARNTFPEIKNIVIYGKGFPCTLAPFLYDTRYRIELVSKNIIHLQKILAEVKRSIVYVDLVDFLTGELVDIDRIAETVHNNNSILAVDGIQGMGYLPIRIEETGADFLFAGTSKWLLGPQGSGFIYINDKHIEKCIHRNMGWLSLDYKTFESFETLSEPRNDASAVESGTRNVIGILMMKENLKLLNSIGINEIYEHNLEGAKMIAKKAEIMGAVTQQSEMLKTPIVSLRTKNIKHLYKYLIDKGVIVSFRENYVRFAYHIFNTTNEAEKLVKILNEYKI